MFNKDERGKMGGNLRRRTIPFIALFMLSAITWLNEIIYRYMTYTYIYFNIIYIYIYIYIYITYIYSEVCGYYGLYCMVMVIMNYGLQFTKKNNSFPR